MKQFISFYLLLACLTPQLFFANSVSSEEKNNPQTSETRGVVSGSVYDKTYNEPLAYVTIAIKNTSGEIVTGTISDENGEFSVNTLSEGKYLVEIQYIGFNTYSKEIEITKDNAKINLGLIQLEEAVAALDEVTVVAERSTMVQKIDRKVITVGKDLTTVGATASEIMNNIPSVNVDQDGNISLRGNANVRILIDGRPTNMDAAQILRQIPSTSIKQIELITNPSAKYDPQGMSGIINIILHKNSNNGFNGDINLNLTEGENARFNSNINLNYRQGKFNFYGTYGAYAGMFANDGRITKYNNPDTNIDESSLERFLGTNNRKTHLLKFGVDFHANDRNTFSAYTTKNIFESDFYTDITVDFFAEGIPSIAQIADFRSDNNINIYNFAYKHKFNDQGHEIHLEADYNTYESDEIARFSSPTHGAQNYRDLVDYKRDLTTINLDYTNPLSETSKLELGLEARFQRTDNNYDTNNATLNNADFFYHRDILSGYATFGQNFDKWAYQFGARLESYKVDAAFNQEGEETSFFTDDIFTVYPSAFVSYNLNEKNTVQLSYSRRVDRPGIQQISPIREFSTPQITVRGNQELVPQFTNSIEINYTKQLEKGSFTAGAFYRMIRDEINIAIQIDPLDPTRLIQSFDNFDDNNAYGFEFSGSYKPTKWWSVNASFDLYVQNLNGIVGTENVTVENTAYTARMNNSFKATKDLTFQLFGFYRGPNSMLQFDIEEMYFVNAGFRYNMLQGRATFSFNFNDIFDTQRSIVTTDRPTPFDGTFLWESQTWMVGLSYRFGGSNNKALQRKQRDANEASGGGFF